MSSSVIRDSGLRGLFTLFNSNMGHVDSVSGIYLIGARLSVKRPVLRPVLFVLFDGFKLPHLLNS